MVPYEAGACTTNNWYIFYSFLIIWPVGDIFTFTCASIKFEKGTAIYSRAGGFARVEGQGLGEEAHGVEIKEFVICILGQFDATLTLATGGMEDGWEMVFGFA